MSGTRGMTFLTDFADQAVVLPVVAVVAFMLVAMGWRRGALVWLGVVGATFGVILALKLVFLGCQPVFHRWSLRSASGHTAAASVVVGGFAALLGGRELAVLTASVLAALAIGSSRVELGAHSLPEVFVGAAVGITGAWVLWHLVGRPPVRRPVTLLAVALVVAAVAHGTRLPAEETISRLAQVLLRFIPACREG